MKRPRKRPFYLPFAIVAGFVAIIESCLGPTTAPGPSQPVSFRIDTVGSLLADTVDLYYNGEVSWGLALDTMKADSLAYWFAQSGFRIQEMWFPASGPICFIPFRTYNFVTIRLAQADTLVDTLGFVRTNALPGCFPQWRHWTFIRPA